MPELPPFPNRRVSDARPVAPDPRDDLPHGARELQTYLFLFALGFSLVGALTAVLIRTQYTSNMAVWNERQSSLADDRSRMVSDWLDQRRGDAETLASRSSVIRVLSSPTSGSRPAPNGDNLRALTATLEDYARAYRYVGVYAFDASGEEVARTPGAEPLAKSMREISRQAAASGMFSLDIIERPGATLLGISAPVYIVASSVPGPQRRAVGTVVLTADLDQSLFPNFSRETTPTRTGETVLVRRAGQEVEYLTPLRNLSGRPMHVRRPLARELAASVALEGPRTFGEFVDYRAVRVLAAVRRIEATRWGVISKIDRAEALEHFRRLAGVEVVAAALLLVAFGGVLATYRRYAATMTARRGQQKFQALVRAAAQLVWTTDPQGQVTDIPEWRAYTGQSPEEVKGWGWTDALHPEDREATAAIWRQAVKDRSIYSTEYRVRRHDGQYRYFSARGVPVVEPNGEIREWVGFCADIHDQKQAEQELRRLNRALKTLSECNQAMVRAQDETELLEGVCRILVNEGGYGLAWAGRAEHDESKTIRPVAIAGKGGDFLAATHLSWAEGEEEANCAARAIRSGQICVARNTTMDTAPEGWRVEALRCGHSACLAVPLSSGQQPFGVLNVCSCRVEAFDAEEIRLLTELSHDLAYGIQALRTRAERLGAQEALRRANAYNRSLIEASLDPLVTISAEGRITDVNAATEKATGCTREELIGTDFSDYFTDPAKARAGYQQVFREGFVQDYELEIRHRDGRLIPVLYNATVYRDERGEINGVFAAARDISARHRAEGALRRANAYNRNLIEASLDPLVTISPDGKVTDVNVATEKVTGVNRAELIGTDFSDYFTDPEKARAGYQQVFREGLVQDYELEIRHRTGHLTPVLYNATVYRDERDEVVGVFAAARDITERKHAEAEIRNLNESLERRVRERTAELEAANKELEAFTYSVSHDLRAPLRHVDGFSRLLLEEFGDRLPEGGRHYLDRIRNGTRQMGQLVDDLLNLSRVGRRELSLQITGLGSLVQEVIAELKVENPGRKIAWEIASLPFVECDPMLMRQVLLNLLSNAVKFTRPREIARIEVGTRSQNSQEAVFVRDNGVGFSMRFADKLFGVFQRLHRAEDFEGTGVGLATVQRIIHKHHGTVWAEAELDRGATFYFTLGTSAAATAPVGKAA